MQTSTETVINDANSTAKKVWSKPVFEIIRRDYIKSATTHHGGEHTSTGGSTYQS